MVRPLLSLLPLLLLISGCSDSNQGTITLSVIGGEARAGNPNRQTLDAPSLAMTGALMQGLVQFDAQGEIEPALAERWMVTDDGLSYIFRIRRTAWSDGSPVTAAHVAKSLRTSIAGSSRNPLKSMLGTVREILPMTESVLEIRLSVPQADLLSLLADPRMAIIHKGRGTGPYRLHRSFPSAKLLRPVLPPGAIDTSEEAARKGERRIRGESAARAVARFSIGNAALVLGGRFSDYPIAAAAATPARTVRVDPVAGVFGLIPARRDGPAGNRNVRQALAMAIDRAMLVQQFGASGWTAAEALMPGRIAQYPQAIPDWASLPQDQRVLNARKRLEGLSDAQKNVRIALPKGPGARLLFALLARDWQRIGVTAKAVAPGASADFRLMDEVAPSANPLWYLAPFAACATTPLCSPKVRNSLSLARQARPEERAAFFAEADKVIAQDLLFIPIARPLRWSLVTPNLGGFAENARAIHPLNRLASTQN